MPGRFLTDSERDRLNRLPNEIPYNDLITFFTLSDSDKKLMKYRRGAHNRLGFAIQLCSLRYLGFCPDDLSTTPFEILDYVAKQVGLAASMDILNSYGDREHTRTDHQQEIQDYLGFRKAGPSDLKVLAEWLLKRALEHDKPTLLFQITCERLYHEICSQ